VPLSYFLSDFQKSQKPGGRQLAFIDPRLESKTRQCFKRCGLKTINRFSGGDANPV
jgi:hypothetical protein